MEEGKFTNNSLKILVVGDGHSPIHEVAVYDEIKKMGLKVEGFYWFQYFLTENKLIRIWRKIQNKFLFGPSFNSLNLDLVEKVKLFKPDLIFIYRGTHIKQNTILKIKQLFPNCIIYGYNNDDPFAKGHPFWLWRHFLKSIPVYDKVFAYRKHNLEELKSKGAKQVGLLRSWFIPELNYPVTLSEDEKLEYNCDVVFIGHFEEDGRLQSLEEIVRNGFKLKLYGSGREWNHHLEKSELLKHLSPIKPVWKEEYNKALCGSKIALCFLSKLNRDSYTRRCFEIPATGTFLLSEYSEDLSSLYKEGEEFDMFTSKLDLIKKIQKYLGNDKLRESIAANGKKRVFADGHDIGSRIRNLLLNVTKVN